MKNHSLVCVMLAVAVLALTVVPAFTQEPGLTSGAASTQAVSINKMDFRTVKLVCGGKTQAGTPIAGNSPPAAGNKTSGTITISGIPPLINGLPTTVERADLFWTVLTNQPVNLPVGQTILLNGTPVTGFKIGTANQSPCFPQANTIAYRAIVTSLVPAPGNGVYTVSGFPGGPLISSEFTEGATLQVLWSNPNGALLEDNLYHAIGDVPGSLAVTLGETFSQTMAIFGTNAVGPVSATLYEVIGNGQANGYENLRFDGPCAGDINLDNKLDGSTAARPPNSCSSTVGSECFWDDDVENVAAQFACPAGNGATSATLSSDGSLTNDCFDWPALNLLTSTDAVRACALCGIYVDNQCPALPPVPWRNHGEYVSCIAQAAERCLSGLPYGGTCQRAEIQSCVVNPRARSDVGKP